MKHLNTFKGLFLTLLFACTGTAFAHNFEVDGVYYNILSKTDKTVEVTYKGTSYSQYSNEYIGSIFIPESVTYNGITYIVTSIRYCAFRDCNTLTSIKISDSITSIGFEAFYGCSSLTNIEIPNSVTSIEYSAFYGCTDLTSVVIGHASIDILGSETSIGYSAFENCISLTSVVIGSNVTSIGSYAFKGCTSLKELRIEDGIETLKLSWNYCNYSSTGEGLFYDCPLKTLYLGRNLSYNVGASNYDGYYGFSPFNGKNTLTSVTIGNTVTIIGEHTFRNCYNLTDIIIPGEVTSIGEYAFYGCCGLTNIEIPNSVTSIGEGAFRGCGITSITIPNNITNIEYGTFCGCDIISITIPNSVTNIKKYAFAECYSLTSVEIPNSVTSIGEEAFGGCLKLKEVHINDIVAWCNISFSDFTSNPLYNTNNLYLNGELVTELVIPDNVTSIGNYTFYNCSNLVSVEIPNSITSIGYEAFYRCSSLSNVEIPSCVTSIDRLAFAGCNKLENIYFRSNPQIGNSAIPSTSIRHLVLDDSNRIDFNTSNKNTYSDVSYTRTSNDGKYGTIILPFAPDAASLENYAFYELAESGNGYMRFEEVTTPVSNTPYIYTLREGKENVAITGGVTTISSNIVTPEVDGWQTVGSFTNQALDTSNGNYYAFSPSKNEINKITKNLTVLPYRAYFKSDNASKSAFSVYISGTTGVKEVLSSEIDGFETEVVYDLSGRKILDPVKGGIYIINGKKVKL